MWKEAGNLEGNRQNEEATLELVGYPGAVETIHKARISLLYDFIRAQGDSETENNSIQTLPPQEPHSELRGQEQNIPPATYTPQFQKGGDFFTMQ